MDGIILINKEKGTTSHDVVAKLRKILNTKKVGHAGTLDPLATGVLTVLVGRGTKLAKYLIEHNKTYIATLKLGEKTTTGDLEGEIIERREYGKFSNADVEKVLNEFLGKNIQVPPMYSAIKVGGKKLYEYARNGEKVEIPEREIEIFSMKLISFEDDKICFEVSCSKGTYIRTLCEDIAEKLGTLGTMADLKRTKVDRFKIEDAISIEKLEELKLTNIKGTDNDFEVPIISIENVFSELNRIDLNDMELERFLNGNGIKSSYDITKVYCNNKFIGIAKSKNGYLIRDIIV